MRSPRYRVGYRNVGDLRVTDSSSGHTGERLTHRSMKMRVDRVHMLLLLSKLESPKTVSNLLDYS